MNILQTSFLSMILLTVSSICPAQKLLVSNDYPIRPVPFTSVKVTDEFWAPRIKLNHDVTIPIAINQCYVTGRGSIISKLPEA